MRTRRHTQPSVTSLTRSLHIHLPCSHTPHLPPPFASPLAPGRAACRQSSAAAVPISVTNVTANAIYNLSEQEPLFKCLPPF